MNEIPNVLESNEKTEWEGKPRLAPTLVKIIFSSLVVGGLIGILTGVLLNQKLNFSSYLFVGILVGILIFILSMLIGILGWSVTHYTSTNKRVILQTGIIGRDFKSVDYDQIQNVSVSVGLLGLIFKTGNVRIFTGEMESYRSRGPSTRIGGIRVGGSSMGVKSKYDMFHQVDSPYEVMKLIQEHLSKRKEDLYAGRT